MAERRLGLGDRPIASADDERLGITDYAAALTEFIGQCDTPLTIGLQGDWGSGKTSLMNLIRAGLEAGGGATRASGATGAASAPTGCVWVNTWKFAQLEAPDTLFLAVLAGIVDELGAHAREGSKTKKLAADALRFFARAGAQVVKAQARAHLGLDVDLARGGPAEETPGYKLAGELKESLASLVGGLAQEHGRVVLFVDDLDRIPPERAVQILEALKNFLDVSGLVTVLACDYGVVSRGLAARMGVSEQELGRSFFDKIIQVPFRMPVHAYNAHAYVAELLTRIDVHAAPDEVRLAADVLRRSVGLNPRALKRQANTLLLLLKVAERSPVLRDRVRTERRPLIMMALTAMEAVFGDVHRYLAEILAEESGFAAARDLLMQGLLPSGPQHSWVDACTVTAADGSRTPTASLASFLESFRDLVDADGDKTISDAELAILREMVRLSQISSLAADGPYPEPPERTGRGAWTPEEFWTSAGRLGLSRARLEAMRRAYDLACQLEGDAAGKIQWGRGKKWGSFIFKAGQAEVFSVSTSGELYLLPTRWPTAGPDGRPALLAAWDDALRAGGEIVGRSEASYIDIAERLLAEDPTLDRAGPLLRRAAAACSSAS